MIVAKRVAWHSTWKWMVGIRSLRFLFRMRSFPPFWPFFLPRYHSILGKPGISWNLPTFRPLWSIRRCFWPKFSQGCSHYSKEIYHWWTSLAIIEFLHPWMLSPCFCNLAFKPSSVTTYCSSVWWTSQLSSSSSAVVVWVGRKEGRAMKR